MGYIQRGDIYRKRTDGEAANIVGIYREKNTHGKKTYTEGTHTKSKHMSKGQT